MENFRLRVFRAVAGHLNFRMAAEELLLTQSAVTQQIKALESEMERWVNQDEAQLDMTRRAVELVRKKYTRERERADVVMVFGEALERVADMNPGSSFLNWRLVPSTSEQLERKVRPIVKGRRRLRLRMGRNQ